jgi:hypothetical protein
MPRGHFGRFGPDRATHQGGDEILDSFIFRPSALENGEIVYRSFTLLRE